MTEKEAIKYREIVRSKVDMHYYPGALDEYLKYCDIASINPFFDERTINDIDCYLLKTIDTHELGLGDSKQFVITNVAGRNYRFVCLDIFGVEFIFNARTNTGRKIIRKFLKSNAVFYSLSNEENVQLTYLRLILKYPVDVVNEKMKEMYPLPPALSSLLQS